MKSFFFRFLLFGSFFCGRGVSAFDFAQIESVIAGIEDDTGLVPVNGWVVVISEEFSVGSVDKKSQTRNKKEISVSEKKELFEREIPRFYNRKALCPLSSVKKISTVRKTPGYADLFFEAGQPKLIADGENSGGEVQEPCLQDNEEKKAAEPFKNRRRPKRKPGKINRLQKSEPVVSLNNNFVQATGVSKKTVEKVDDQVLLDRLAGKIRAIVCD
jgi:hypothetical protein